MHSRSVQSAVAAFQVLLGMDLAENLREVSAVVPGIAINELSRVQRTHHGLRVAGMDRLARSQMWKALLSIQLRGTFSATAVMPGRSNSSGEAIAAEGRRRRPGRDRSRR